jgi:hypothetical protein
VVVVAVAAVEVQRMQLVLEAAVVVEREVEHIHSQHEKGPPLHLE